MFKSSEDKSLAFFESLILTPNGINEFRDVFFRSIEEAFTSTSRSDEDVDVISVIEWDEYNNPITLHNSFKDFLKERLAREIKLSKGFIESRASKILSGINPNKIFFQFTESILIDLNKKSNTIDYLEVKVAVIDIMQFYYSKYHKYYTFSTEYLDTLSVYRKTTKKVKTTLSFNWRENNKRKEIEYLYNSLINSSPPFINSSLETFTKAFTYKKLEQDEAIKWLCKSVKNKKVTSKVTLVVLLESLFEKGCIISDLNDFNKTVENLFCLPNGVKLKDIKNTKQEKSKNPSRILEIQHILDGLSKIA